MISKHKLIKRIFNNQGKTSRVRGHRPPEYTVDELYEWAMSQKKFHELYSEYVNSGLDKMLVPSVDRKNDSVHYCMSNIQLMTWEENQTKGHNSNKRKVSCFTRSGRFLFRYDSIAEASKDSHIPASNITNCCRGNIKTACDLIWKYDD